MNLEYEPQLLFYSILCILLMIINIGSAFVIGSITIKKTQLSTWNHLVTENKAICDIILERAWVLSLANPLICLLLHKSHPSKMIRAFLLRWLRASRGNRMSDVQMFTPMGFFFLQMATLISSVKRKHLKTHRLQTSNPWVKAKETVRQLSRDCCAGNLWNGRWASILSPTYKGVSGRKRFMRICGTKPSIIWLQGRLFRTLSRWLTKSARLSMVSNEMIHLLKSSGTFPGRCVLTLGLLEIQTFVSNPMIRWNFPGSGRRYQLYAMQTSKACNILSKYTAFVPIDLDSNEYLPIAIEYLYAGESRLCFLDKLWNFYQYVWHPEALPEETKFDLQFPHGGEKPRWTLHLFHQN